MSVPVQACMASASAPLTLSELQVASSPRVEAPGCSLMMTVVPRIEGSQPRTQELLPRGLRGLQALRDGLPHGLLEHPCLLAGVTGSELCSHWQPSKQASMFCSRSHWRLLLPLA